MLKIFKIIYTLIFLLFLRGGVVLAGNITTYSINGRQVRAAEGEILVKFKKGTSQITRKFACGKAGARRKQKIKALGVEQLEIEKGKSLEKVLKRLQEDENVEYAEPNYIYSAQKLPREYTSLQDLQRQQWGVVYSMFPSAWEYTTGSNEVVIAVIDSYIDIDHPELESNIHSVKRNFISGEPTSYPEGVEGEEHGTHVAGIAAAAEGVEGGKVAGAAWNVKIMPLRVLENDEGNLKDIATAISSAAYHGADIINLSLGGPDSNGLEDAVNVAYSSGVFLVAASGNGGDDTLMYPAAFENVVAVGASNKDNRRAAFSTYGDWVDLAAPGVGIYSTLPDGGYGEKSGTSMATPFVSGAAALLVSYLREQAQWPQKRNMVNEEHLQHLKTLIVDDADDYSSFGTGEGVLNVYRSLSSAAGFDGERGEVIVYPNPFNPFLEYATIRLPKGSEDKFSKLKVFSLDGNLVKEKDKLTGNVIKWNGTNDEETTVAPGLYFFMAETEEGKMKRGKVTVLIR